MSLSQNNLSHYVTCYSLVCFVFVQSAPAKFLLKQSISTQKIHLYSLFLIGEKLLYNVVLASAVQHESAISTHISLPLKPSSHPSPPFHLSVSSQSISLSFLCYTEASHQLFYTWQCIYVNATLSIHPLLAFCHSVHKSILYLCLSIPAIHLYSTSNKT